MDTENIRGGAHRECPDCLLPLSGETVLANGPGDSLSASRILAAGAGGAGGVFLCGISALFLMQRNRYPFLLVGWLWFIGTLVPVIGLVQVGRQSMADRYTYIPSLGVLMLVIWARTRWPDAGVIW